MSEIKAEEVPADAVRYRDDTFVAKETAVIDCPGNHAGGCIAHLLLMDRARTVHAVAPLDRNMLLFLKREIERRLQ